MRLPSRRMSKYVSPQTSTMAWLLFVGLIAAWGYGVWNSPYAFGGFTAVLGVAVAYQMIATRAHLRRLANERVGESICTFAREANCRENDSWAVRAVYEQIQEYLGKEFKNFPVRWSDDFERDLKIDLEDVEDIIAIEAAQRARRNLANPHTNPLYGKVKTVGDLVRFLVSQPNESMP